MKTYELKEWKTLPVGDGSLTRPEADRFFDLAQHASDSGRLRGKRVLSWKNSKALKAHQVVGVLTDGNSCIEILPKIDGENGAVRKSLIRMLAVTQNIDVADGELASHDVNQYDLLELLIRLFANRLIIAVRRGLPRRYVSCEDDLRLLRGKLNVPRQVTQLAFRPDIIACRYDEFSENTPLNRVFKAAVRLLLHKARSTANVRLLTELNIRFENVGASAAPLKEPVRLDRTNTAYHDLYRLACLFLRNSYQTTTVDSKTQGFTLLFAMNDLFEKFIGEILVRGLGRNRVKLQAQDKYALLQDETRRGIFNLQPDVLVWPDHDQPIVLDTKWKELKGTDNDLKLGVTQSDVYQMLAYQRAYDASRVILLYPWSKESGIEIGIASNWTVASSDRPFNVATVDLGKLSSGLPPIDVMPENLMSVLRGDASEADDGRLAAA